MHSVRVKIFVNNRNNNNYCIFFLKIESHNVRLIQTMSDHFFTENVGENVGGILKVLGEWVQSYKIDFILLYLTKLFISLSFE